MKFIAKTKPSLHIYSGEKKSSTSFSVALRCVGLGSVLINKLHRVDHRMEEDQTKFELFLVVGEGSSKYDAVQSKRYKSVLHNPVGEVQYFFDNSQYFSLEFHCHLEAESFWRCYESASLENSELEFSCHIINLDYGNDPDGYEKVWDLESVGSDSPLNMQESVRYLEWFSFNHRFQ